MNYLICNEFNLTNVSDYFNMTALNLKPIIKYEFCYKFKTIHIHIELKSINVFFKLIYIYFQINIVLLLNNNLKNKALLLNNFD
jgi:hypothetical protein